MSSNKQMYEPRALRLDCLRLAHEHCRHHAGSKAEDVVSTAKKFMAFITEEEDNDDD